MAPFLETIVPAQQQPDANAKSQDSSVTTNGKETVNGQMSSVKGTHDMANHEVTVEPGGLESEIPVEEGMQIVVTQSLDKGSTAQQSLDMAMGADGISAAGSDLKLGASLGNSGRRSDGAVSANRDLEFLGDDRDATPKGYHLPIRSSSFLPQESQEQPHSSGQGDRSMAEAPPQNSMSPRNEAVIDGNGKGEESLPQVIGENLEDLVDDTAITGPSSAEGDGFEAVHMRSIRGGELETPEYKPGVRRLPSEFTDAGDQLYMWSRKQAALSRDARSLPAIQSTAPAPVDGTSDPPPSQNASVPKQPTRKKTLQLRLFAAMQPVSNPHASHKDKDFVPKDELSRLITEESVAEELIKFREQTQRTIDEIQTCAHQICSEELVPNNKPCNNEEMEGCLRTYRKIFAILVLIEKTTSIFLFLHHQVSDLDLPLVLVKDPEEPGLKRLQRRPDADGKPSTEIPIFETWSPWQMSSFEDSQWRFLAPFFSRGGYNDVKHFPLRENHILPFIPFNGISTATTKDSVIEKIDCGEGGYGKVMMVRIHPAHHNFHVNGAGTLTSGAKESMKFAIKQLLRPDRVSFKKEVSILKKFTGAGAHPHVVSLLATYEQFEKFHLIFYKADCDLCRLWRDAERKNPMSREEVLWMARQCEGIANGLLMLHRHFTRSRTSSITRISSNPPVEEKQTMTGAKRAPSAEDKSVSFGPPPPQTRQRADKEPLGERSHATLSIPTSTHVGLPADRSGCRDAGARPAKLVEMLEPQGEFIRQYGRHGDLKPQNILYYSDDPNILSSAPDSPITNAMTVIDCVDAPPQPESESTRGNLKICDFGHAELNSLYSKSRVRSSVANTMTYRPPECDVQPKIVRQSYDIWSLGCVYLEFVAWMLGGWELVKQFGEKRLARDRFQNWMSTDTFFTIYYCDKKGKAMAKIKSAVTDFIANLHCHPNCTEFFHDFLNLIRLNMLVIEPNDQSMTRRAYCEEIHLTLASLRKKCLSDNEYATTKNPWKTDRLTTMVSEPVEVDITDPGRAQLLEYKEFLREGISLVEKNLVTPPRGANSSRVPASV